ncbi:heavy metal transport/detoxification protein [Clostridium acetobutylicum]|nr:heavy metal transport/detoxification protein [Clostridium acetobutylicum]
MSIKKDSIKVYDMTCTSCEKKIEKALKTLPGVISVKASFVKQIVTIEYDDTICTIQKIKSEINSAGYRTEAKNIYKIAGFALIALFMVFMSTSTSGFDITSKLKGATYFIIFIVGVLTSIHCVGMCGGILLSQSINKEGNKSSSIKSAILYNSGRVLSYTILGGIVGALGSVFNLSLGLKSFLQIFAAAFMIIMGLNMSGFSLFRKIQLKLPFPRRIFKKAPKTPFFIGMLNGLMPCGPLQTMQLYALSTGSPIKGALSLFVFSLGTIPLMMTFGVLSGFISKGSTKVLLKFSGILVMVLGIIMGGRGLALAGVNVPTVSSIKNSVLASPSKDTNNSASKAKIVNGVQVIKMTADENGYTPNGLYVEKNKPVKWIIDGKSLNSCNGTIVIPDLNKEITLKSGENVIEFTPKGKDISFSCSMGMIRGVIKVVDNVASVDTSKKDSSIPKPSSGMSCCTGGSSASSSSQASSIYGSDISKVPTANLVNKANLNGNSQSLTLTGKGYEFQPLISVLNKGVETKLSVDLNGFDSPNGEYSIIDLNTRQTVTTFNGKKGIVEVDFKIDTSGSYGIVKDNNMIEALEVVDDLNTSDLEQIRTKYLGR